MRFKNTFVMLGLLASLPIHSSNAYGNTRAQTTSSPGSVVHKRFVPTQELGRITQANWQRHPKIKAVRHVVQSVNTGLQKSAYKTSKREFEYCEPYEDTLRKIAVDSRGVVRRYEKQGGSEDSSLNFQHYYDDSGRLRFVFISGGAVNRARLEHRIYFDETGKRIWEGHKYVQGPEYSFPAVWPEDQLQRADPAKAFAAASPCPETKSPERGKKNAK